MISRYDWVYVLSWNVCDIFSDVIYVIWWNVVIWSNLVIHGMYVIWWNVCNMAECLWYGRMNVIWWHVVIWRNIWQGGIMWYDVMCVIWCNMFYFQLWHCRFSLMMKLRMYSVLESEFIAFRNLDTPDIYYEFYPQQFPGKRGTFLCQ